MRASATMAVSNGKEIPAVKEKIIETRQNNGQDTVTNSVQSHERENGRSIAQKMERSIEQDTERNTQQGNEKSTEQNTPKSIKRRTGRKSPYPMLTDDPRAAERAFMRRDALLDPLRVAADGLTAAVAAVLADSGRFMRFAVREEEGELKSVDTRVIKELASTLKELAAATRGLYDIPTDAERQSALIAAGRYRLSERKADADGDGGGQELLVSFGEAADDGDMASLGE